MGQLLCPEALERAREALDKACHDWRYLSAVGGDGPIAEFEETFGKAAGGKYAIACSNATSALFMALMASGVGRGDEVILPAYTWPQTLSPVLLTGATPVFADIDENSVTVSPGSIRGLMTRRTRAIIAVHLFGIPADIDAIEDLARERDCVTIYDAAQGFGAFYDGRPVGSFGDFAAFSLGRGKLLSAGEGGVLICKSRSGYERALAFSQHPLRMHRQIDDDGIRARLDGISMNFRMHPIVASLALGQFEGLLKSEELANLRKRFARLRNEMKDRGLDGYLPAVAQKGTASGTAVPLIVPRNSDTNQIKDLADIMGLTVYSGGIQGPLHLTETIREGMWLWQRGLRRKRSLPSHATHAKHCCPNTERRCSLPQMFFETRRQRKDDFMCLEDNCR